MKKKGVGRKRLDTGNKKKRKIKSNGIIQNECFLPFPEIIAGFVWINYVMLRYIIIKKLVNAFSRSASVQQRHWRVSARDNLSDKEENFMYKRHWPVLIKALFMFSLQQNPFVRQRIPLICTQINLRQLQNTLCKGRSTGFLNVSAFLQT